MKDGHSIRGKAWEDSQARLPKLYVETACDDQHVGGLMPWWEDGRPLLTVLRFWLFSMVIETRFFEI